MERNLNISKCRAFVCDVINMRIIGEMAKRKVKI